MAAASKVYWQADLDGVSQLVESDGDFPGRVVGSAIPTAVGSDFYMVTLTFRDIGKANKFHTLEHAQAWGLLMYNQEFAKAGATVEVK